MHFHFPCSAFEIYTEFCLGLCLRADVPDLDAEDIKFHAFVGEGLVPECLA